MASVNPSALRQLVALAARRGPDAIRWLGVVGPYLSDPEYRERFRALTERFSQARTARTPDARLAQQIAALVDHAESARDDAGDDPARTGERAQAEAWLRRAKALDRSRNLLLGAPGDGVRRGSAGAPRRRRAVERLTPEIERLREEMLEAMLALGHGAARPVPGTAAAQVGATAGDAPEDDAAPDVTADGDTPVDTPVDTPPEVRSPR